MVIRAISYLALFILTAPCFGAVRQPASVEPIQASGNTLFASADILGRSFDYSEQRWRVARARVIQQSQEIPTDYLDELGELNDSAKQAPETPVDANEEEQLQPIPLQQDAEQGTKAPAQSPNQVIFGNGCDEGGQAIRFNQSCTRSCGQSRCRQSCTP